MRQERAPETQQYAICPAEQVEETLLFTSTWSNSYEVWGWYHYL